MILTVLKFSIVYELTQQGIELMKLFILFDISSAIYIYICVCLCVCMCVCSCVCTCACVCVCMRVCE